MAGSDFRLNCVLHLDKLSLASWPMCASISTLSMFQLVEQAAGAAGRLQLLVVF